MFRTVFPSIIRWSGLHIQQQAFVNQILLSIQRLHFSLWMMSYVRMRQWKWRPEFDSFQGQRILFPPPRTNGPEFHLLTVHCKWVGRNWPICEANHSLSASVEIKNKWRFTSSASLRIHEVMIGHKTFFYHITRKYLINCFFVFISSFLYQWWLWYTSNK